jgi:hypothetical protein
MQSTVGEYKYLALAGPLFPALIFHLARFVDGTGGGGVLAYRPGDYQARRLVDQQTTISEDHQTSRLAD